MIIQIWALLPEKTNTIMLALPLETRTSGIIFQIFKSIPVEKSLFFLIPTQTKSEKLISFQVCFLFVFNKVINALIINIKSKNRFHFNDCWIRICRISKRKCLDRIFPLSCFHRRRME